MGKPRNTGDCQETLEARGQAWKSLSLGPSKGTHPAHTLISDFQNCETGNVCCSELPSLGNFAWKP